MSDAIYLRAEDARCFRLATGAMSPRLADELESLGRVFEREGRKIEVIVEHLPSRNARLGVQEDFLIGN